MISIPNTRRSRSAQHGIDTDVSELLGRFADAQHQQQRLRPARLYRDVVGEAFAALGNAEAAPVLPEERQALVESIGTWPAFPDTLDALRALTRHGFLLGVVSNVDRVSFEGTRRVLDGLIDVVVTAEDVGAYKPDREMFEALASALADMVIEPAEVLHVAQSRFHGIAPGRAFGLDTVWVDRRAGRPGRGVTMPSEAEPDLRVESLGELVALIDQARAAG